MPLFAYTPANANFALSKPIFNFPLIYEKETQKIQVETLAVKVVAESGRKTPADRGAIIEYIKNFNWNVDIIAFIINCESSWDVRAFNFEPEAKKRWAETGGKSGTPYSSCGLLQVNSPECEKTESTLFDWKYNIDQGYKKWKAQGYGAWVICKNKYDRSKIHQNCEKDNEDVQSF